MSVEQWWNNPDRGKPKYFEKRLSQCHRKSQMDWLGFELEPSLGEAATNGASRDRKLLNTEINLVSF